MTILKMLSVQCYLFRVGRMCGVTDTRIFRFQLSFILGLHYIASIMNQLRNIGRVNRKGHNTTRVKLWQLVDLIGSIRSHANTI